LAAIIEARIDELFALVLQELRRSGYDGLLSAGVVLTGGTANLRGIRHNAARVMSMPVKIAAPEKVSGLSDKLKSPAYSTSVGLMRFATRLGEDAPPDIGPGTGRDKTGPDIGKAIGDFFSRLLPD
jgi:cell division protein FtsA